MSINRNEILKYCQEYLKVSDFNDSTVNGLQVEGKRAVSKIITGVSLSKELIETAIKKKAGMIIVHHGFFKNAVPSPLVVKDHIRMRLKLLLENNINLLGFHLPLDAHPIIGNSISLIKIFGLKKYRVLSTDYFGDVGYIGEFAEPLKIDDFIDLVDKKLNTNSYAIKAGPKKVKTVGVVSGAASPAFLDAAEMGVDTYVSGDIRENTVREVEEMKINFINAGHYNTEKLGIKNLGELIQRKFNIEVEFIDIPCDI